MTDSAALLAEAGFTAAAEHVTKVREKAARLAVAYEHYRYVGPEAIKAFNGRLKKATIARTGTKGKDLVEHFDVLRFTPIATFQGIPPTDVLQAVTAAKGREVFDAFEVADIASVAEYKDPIVFGRITGCGDRFYIAQWGDDVSITDLLGEHGG